MNFLDNYDQKLTIYNLDIIKTKINILKKLNGQNPQRDLTAKIKSVVSADIFASLLIIVDLN